MAILPTSQDPGNEPHKPGYLETYLGGAEAAAQFRREVAARKRMEQLQYCYLADEFDRAKRHDPDIIVAELAPAITRLILAVLKEVNQ